MVKKLINPVNLGGSVEREDDGDVKRQRSEKKRLAFENSFFFILTAFTFLIIFFVSVSAVNQPEGPDSVNVTGNETKGTASSVMVNVSGGRIATLNITATTQNPRWKGFVGHVSGTFTLDDSTGATLYDWTMTSFSGEVYATRNSSTPIWANIQCSNRTLLVNENVLMNHTSSDDNVSKTFNDTTHASFVVGSTTISANSCPTLNTYINNATQNTDFEEVALTDSNNFTVGGTLIYASVIETNVAGFDATAYDFQMIVPEIGLQGYTGQTAYYLYVEIS